MIIQCSHCHTNYEVGNSLPPKGRKVRCAACNHVWLARPDNNLDSTPLTSNENSTDSSGDISPPPDFWDTVPKITSESDDAEAEIAASGPDFARDYEAPEQHVATPDASRNQYFDEIYNETKSPPNFTSEKLDQAYQPPHLNGNTNGAAAGPPVKSNGHHLDTDRLDAASNGSIDKDIGDISPEQETMHLQSNGISKLTMFAWITVLSIMAGALIYAYSNPDTTAMRFPATVGIFDAMGIKTNSRGLVIDDVHYEFTTHEQHSAIQVTGVVHNIADIPLKVPSVVVELRDKDDLILFVWATEVKQRNLVSQARAPFDVTIPAPSKLVRKVKLRFSTRP